MQICHQPSLLPGLEAFGFQDQSYTRIVDSFSTAASFSFTKIKAMPIHDRIRAKRESLKLSVQQFADALGVTRAAVNQWEKEGGTAPSRRHQPAVAKLLGISVSELMAETEMSTVANPPQIGFVPTDSKQSLPSALVNAGPSAMNPVADQSALAMALAQLFDTLPNDVQLRATSFAALFDLLMQIKRGQTPAQPTAHLPAHNREKHSA